MALSPPPPAASTLEAASLGESDVPMGDDSLAEALELQYPETEESDPPRQCQADLSDDVTSKLHIYSPLSSSSQHFPIVYGTLGFKAHHLHAVFQTNEVMVCRLCQEYVSSVFFITTRSNTHCVFRDQAIFDRDASFHELANHCEASHSEACHLIVALTPEQTKAWLEIALVA